MSRSWLFLTWIILGLPASLAHAQLGVNNMHENIIPPSPTAAALGSYGETPIDQYTGQPSISIPIYTIKTNQHALDISLTYNSTIRVNQEASWVGLGWSLNAGGVITRTVRGLDDIEQTVGDYSTGYYESEPLPDPNTSEPEAGDFYIIDSSSPSFDPDHFQYFREVKERRIDSEPDIFYYNFANYSGSFVLDKRANNSTVYIKEQDNLKFEISFLAPNSDYGTWKVTTPDGYIYSFTTVELVENHTTADLPLTEDQINGVVGYIYEPVIPKLASTWYLDYIEAPNGERINFTYDATYGRTYSNVNFTHRRYDRRFELWYNGPIILDNCEEYPEHFRLAYSYHWASRQVIDNIYLSKVSFKGGEISFETLTRKDIEIKGGTGAQMLYMIRVENDDDEEVKRFTFDHDYFNSSHQDSPGNLKYRMCRLKLRSLTESGKPPYKFSYFDAEDMPSKYSMRVDRWGFYNLGVVPVGQVMSVPTNLPKVTTNTQNGMNTFEGSVRGADATGEYARKGVLESITYPTGGYTMFQFEPNEYYKYSSRMDTVKTYHAFAISEGNADPNWDVYQDPFSVQNEKIYMRLSAYATYGEGLSDDQAIGWLKRSNGDIVKIFRMMDRYYEAVLNGDYILEVAPIPDYHISLSAITYVVNEVFTYKETAGGLRIKKIEDFDFNGNKVNTRKYIYTEDGEVNGYSSGRLLDNPILFETQNVYLHHYTACTRAGLGRWIQGSIADALIRSSHSLYPLGFNAQNGIVGYGVVHEIFGEAGEGGRTIHSFYNDPVPMLGYYGVPGPLRIPRNGKVKTIENKDRDGNLVGKEEYNYEIQNVSLIKGVKIESHYPVDPCLGCFRIGHVIPYYNNYSEWVVLTSKTISEILGGTEMKKTETYKYENPNHKLMTSKITQGSDALNTTVYYKYPHDFSATAPYNTMISKHVISSPVETQEWKWMEWQPEEHMRSEKVNYADWGNNLFLPQSIQTRQLSNPYETRVNFLNYDIKGNLTETQKDSDAKESYVWGYEGLYPVVKAVNVDANELSNKVGQSLIDIGYANGIAGLDSFLTELGNLSNSTQRQSWNTFNQVLRSKFSGDVLVSTWAYAKLVGIAATADPNGMTTFYKYDDAGRLQYTADHDGNIIESYNYHYKN